MAGTAAQLDVLEELARASPKGYLQRQPSGVSKLRELYDQATEAGLSPASATDDIARLHSLFDVALDHGMGGLVRDYIAEVCSDRLLTSSDPMEALLLDGECVRRWVQKSLAVSRQRLTSWLARGLGSVATAGLLSKELSRLQMLQLVAEALQPQPDSSFGSTQQAAATAPPPAELEEARRLVQAARVVAWLGQQQLGFDRAYGRYFSEQEWRSVAAKRREGAQASGSGALFFADLAADLAQHGVDRLAYPPASADRLLAALFLVSGNAAGAGAAGTASTRAGAGSASAAAASGGGGGGASSAGASVAALHAKLALLTYYLADGGFMQPEAIVRGLLQHFGVAPSTTYGWLLQQQLDDGRTDDPRGVQALQQAAELVPLLDGSSLPHRVLQVFATRGQPDIALTLLRQRRELSGSLDEASVALAVRFQNGLLGEAFLGMKQHLAAVAAGSPAVGAAERRRQHAALLVGQLLQYAAMLSVVHAAAQMPFDAVEEEAAIEWLEQQAGVGQVEAGLMLVLYYLLRGRTAEALHAYATRCPRVATTEQQVHLEALLTAAARTLPAAQRALLVQRGSAPALLPADGGSGGAGAGEAAAPVPLSAGIAVEGADVAPALLSVGPTPSQAPLVGSIPVLLEQRSLAAAAAAAADQAAAAAEQAAGSEAAAAAGMADADAQQQAQQGVAAGPPMLFNRAAGGAAGGGRAAPAEAAGPSSLFGAGTAAAAPLAGLVGEGGAAGHDLDRVLGLAPAVGGSRAKRRWGGSAYR